MKKSLADDINCSNEVDSKSEEDVPATISIKLTVVYLDDFDCNNSTENEGEWALNENIAFDYSCVLRLYLPMLGPYTCLYQSQKWHACI